MIRKSERSMLKQFVGLIEFKLEFWFHRFNYFLFIASLAQLCFRDCMRHLEIIAAGANPDWCFHSLMLFCAASLIWNCATEKGMGMGMGTLVGWCCMHGGRFKVLIRYFFNPPKVNQKWEREPRFDPFMVSVIDCPPPHPMGAPPRSCCISVDFWFPFEGHALCHKVAFNAFTRVICDLTDLCPQVHCRSWITLSFWTNLRCSCTQPHPINRWEGNFFWHVSEILK